ncbi:YIEGIA domain-containing protein [Hathewaya limosa]|uniref:Membrane protein YeaQ/YmgE (Transglycosylase-associated protein family) n=1 Tax=Hathewaya limosa TaxID=1536 RepID=A0ABU0JNK3_HATLI|nr:YIEGIA domain-containing protein [Hathewaya limosa]MDQ0478655.1 putative membrane protein YeaQ/YmgE (transglycosylase-associated protein family) [Hathewaya limosa]
MNNQYISLEQIIIIVTSILAGTMARILTIKEDTRQYPSFPNGYMLNLVTGFVASALGSVAIPALLNKNYIAVTWLVIAIQQFREVRKVERESLKDLESTEYAFRGNAYIDGIAKTFEVRNYVSFIMSLVVSLVMHMLRVQYVLLRILISIFVAAIIFYFLTKFLKGKSIKDIAYVRPGKIEIRDSELFVDGIYVTNLLGTDNAINLFKKEGMAVVIYPKEQHFRITLDNFGQRQAALFEATRALGVKRYHFTRKDYKDGRIVIALIPIINDMERLIKVVKETPLLESVKKSHSVMKK